MKRKLLLATVAALSFAAVPAMAQTSPYGANLRVKQVRPTPIRPLVTSYAPQSVKPGATVTIKGKNFVPGTMVMLGSAVIAPTKLTARRIKIAIPSGATDGVLSLVIPNRRRGLTVGALNVVVPPPPAKKLRRGYYDSSWVKSRRSRRLRSRRGLLRRWNRAFLRSPEVKAALSLHARRLARLNRMARLAKLKGLTVLSRRISRAIKKENARHNRNMKKLASKFQLTFKLRASRTSA